jgi:hypothetical protein
LGETEGVLSLFSAVDSSGLSSVYPRRLQHFGIDMEAREEIVVKTLDSFCADNDIHQIHLLKLDVEGHELAALKGATRFLQAGRIDFIQFEFGGCNIDARTFFQDYYYLLTDQYRLYRVLIDGLHELTGYREADEIFITTNFLAARRSLPPLS